MPDVHAVLFDYGAHPVYVRLNLGTETHEGYCFMGWEGILEVSGHTVNYLPQIGEDDSPSYYAQSFPKELREEYLKKWHEDHDASPGKEPVSEAFSYASVSSGELKPHLWNFFQAVRSRQPVVEDVNHKARPFGISNIVRASMGCHRHDKSRNRLIVFD